ncbi:MDR family MFS transporter [Nonomuraea africana]|uniref:EmrB/QacA subfamily drug resistance transporter n=1 Tax=Nonomuraea africana TaxID=46171 RepID=A0ABR9KI37_9ACTN|nr:MDR family MFS transporter [Nonomuraea africana]MBE1561237.1 EmrB/QacA subfamily drug resistance transporter [Nonomuraea africana]
MRADTSARADSNIVPLATTLLVGAMAALLDTTIVAVALDELGGDLAAPVTVIQWVTTSYVLAMTAVIPVVGWSVGRFGVRAMWLVALALFLLGSVLSGAAWSAGSLVGFRVLQGLGGGMILPLTQLTLARAAGPDRLGRVMGVVGLVGQLAPISGPILGGLLIDGWGWRWVFFVNVPIVVVSMVMTCRWFPRDEERSGRGLDVVGLILLPSGVVALLYALTGFETGEGIGLPPLVGAGGAALLAVFVARSLRRSGPSLLDLRLFADRSFRGGTLMMFVLGVTTWGPMFLLPLYYQQLRGLSAFDAGLALAPQSVGLGLAFLLVGRYADRMPTRPLALAGMAVAVAGTIPFAFATAGSDPVLLGAALLVRGVGFGVASLPVSIALYRTLRPAQIPDATSAGNVVQRVGAATGTALMAVLLQSGFTPALTWMLVLTAVGLAAAVALPGRPS